MRRTATIVALTLAGALALGPAPASATPASSVIGNLVSHTVWDGIRIGTSELDEGTITDGALVRDNVVRDATMDGIRVDTNTTATVLRGNIAKGSGDDGLDVDSAATQLQRNLAALNSDLGIEAVPGVSDGGGNRARHNGNPAQCTGVACG